MEGTYQAEESHDTQPEINNLNSSFDYVQLLETILSDSEKIQEVLSFIMEDDEAFREIKKAVKKEFNVDIGKFAGFLGREDPDKKVPIAERDTPYAELVEEFYNNYLDGYSKSQIAFQHGCSVKDVSRAISEYDTIKKQKIENAGYKKRFAFWLAKKMGVI